MAGHLSERAKREEKECDDGEDSANSQESMDRTYPEELGT